MESSRNNVGRLSLGRDAPQPKNRQGSPSLWRNRGSASLPSLSIPSSSSSLSTSDSSPQQFFGDASSSSSTNQHAFNFDSWLIIDTDSSQQHSETPSEKLPFRRIPSTDATTPLIRFEPLIAVPATVEINDPAYSNPPSSDDTLALLLPLLILLSSLLFLLLLFIILVIIVRRRSRIILGDSDGPVDVGREEELEGHGGLQGIEQRWLETVDEPTRQGYQRAKLWTVAYPPSSQNTDITLSQFLSIQEKGVSAWSFDPDYESNLSVYVEARTEITFLPDGQGMTPQEGGGCCVQSNLPLPKINEVYYWEVKMFNKPDTTNVAIGLTTKPYPTFRLPGWNKYSIGIFSADGFKCHNYPFAAQSYGPSFVQGDVIGVGYRPRTGSVFFTRNGKRFEDAFVGLNRYNLFPTVGADGSCEIHVNLGQAGFVFIEANVKKWGLAPMEGTLAPPPAYGQERGSILIETGQGTSAAASEQPPPPPISPYNEQGAFTFSQPTNNQPPANASIRRPSREPNGSNPNSSSSNNQRDCSPSRASQASQGSPPNPPTPHRLDISLHSLHVAQAAEASNANLNQPSVRTRSTNHSGRTPSPPPYTAASNNAIQNVSSSSSSSSQHLNHDPSWNDSNLGGTLATNHQARRGSGRTHAIANAVLGMLNERGLLTPLSTSHPHPTSSSSSTSGGLGSSSSDTDYERVIGLPNTRLNTLRNSSSHSTSTTHSNSSDSDDTVGVDRNQTSSYLTGWINWLSGSR